MTSIAWARARLWCVAASLGLGVVAHIAAGDLVPLNGPWKFQVGDDPRWAEPAWDDRAWETVDLTPPKGAHDDDVGLTGYVPGWSRRGHPGYSGYAWYRIRVAAGTQELVLAGPPAVDSAYQVFADGRLLGSAGDFSQTEPATYSIQPRVFPLVSVQGGTTVIAFRVWMGRAAARGFESGGIHIAPCVGTPSVIESRYRQEWRQTILGYVVEVAEAAAFIVLAALAAWTAFRERSSRSHGWLIAGLFLLAIQRGNQAFYFWTQVESTHGYDILINLIVLPAILGAWSIAAWAETPGPISREIGRALCIGIALYFATSFLSRSWVFPDWSHETKLAIAEGGGILRWGFLCFFIAALIRLFAKGTSLRWLEVAAFFLLGVGIFASELSKLHLPGIWFPFGVGVSRTQYAYATFDCLLARLLLQRLGSRQRRQPGPCGRAP